MLDLQEKMNRLFVESVEAPYSDSLNDEQNQMVSSFIEHCKQHLGLSDLPELNFSVDRNDAPMTTGVFIPQQNVIYVYIKDRAFCDWIRTLAHELTHYKQHVEGRIPSGLEGRNKELEAEANIASGDIVYEFAHKDDANQIIYEW